MQTIFFRLLAEDDKEGRLAQAILNLGQGRETEAAHAVDPHSIRQVPGSPFASWVTERVRGLFEELPPFESDGRRLRLGDHPSNDFRYPRLFWEIPVVCPERDWPPYYKGCNNTAYYDETRLVVDWDPDRQTYRDFFGRPGRSKVRPSNYQYSLLPGLTFPYLPHITSPRSDSGRSHHGLEDTRGRDRAATGREST